MRFGRARATARTTVPRPEGSSCGPRPEAARTTAPVRRAAEYGPRSPIAGRGSHDHALRPVSRTGAPPTYRAGTRPPGRSGSGIAGGWKARGNAGGVLPALPRAEPPVSAPTGAVTRARAPPSRWVSGRYGRARWACSRPARCAKRVGPWGSRGWVCGGCGRWRLSNALSNRALGRWGRVGGWPAGGWAIPLVVRVWGEAEREGFEPSMEREPHTRLAGECLQPLGHLSRRSRW